MSKSQHRQRWIKPLPKQLINKIAAGEVIERPAAVVKELVENSIDADATQIDITVEKSGTKLIRIVDNGCGIEEDQIEIAFSRHATSKIRTFDDLNALYSYGFRGEALPSIASISRLRMVSRTHSASAGTEIIYEGGVLQSIQPIAASPGTTIEIANIFFNTPARRKFLKSEATESRHLSRTSMALAMGRPDIGFSYTVNERKVFVVPPKQADGERVASLLAPGKKFVAIAGEMGPVKVSGHIGMPDMVQSNRFGQYLFINDRYIHSASLSHGLTAGYGELIVRGQFPIGAIHLTVDPLEVDVNVHPAKTEVRLSREREIHDALMRIVKESLRQDGIIPAFKPSTGQATSGFQQGQARLANSATIPGIGSTPANPHFMADLYKNTRIDTDQNPTAVRVDTTTGEIIDDKVTPVQPEYLPSQAEQSPDTPLADGFRLVGRFSDLYLLLQSGENLFIVDQHTAHERVLYEEMLVKVAKQSVDGQNLLFPVQVELNPEQFALLDDSLDGLNEAGFTVGHFGGRMINIEAMPAILGKKSPEKIFLKILDDISSLRKTGYDLKKAMAQSMACRAAVMAGDRLSDVEATHLVERLLKCEDMYSCPHGRPTFIKISRNDLDKQFGRG